MKILILPTILAVSIFIISSTSSCTKEKIVTVIDTDTVTIHIVDTLRTVFNDTSVLGLFTRKQWILDTVYNNYTGPGTGTLVYARGSNNNIYDYDKVRSIFWIGGNADSFNSIGAFYPLTWHFDGIDSTTFTSSSPIIGDYHAKILRLDATHLTVHDINHNALDIHILKP